MAEPTIGADGAITHYPCANCGALAMVPLVDDCTCLACAWKTYGWVRGRPWQSDSVNVRAGDAPAQLFRVVAPYEAEHYRLEIGGEIVSWWPLP